MKVKEFIERTGITIEASLVDFNPNIEERDEWNKGARHFLCTLFYKDRTMEFHYTYGRLNFNNPEDELEETLCNLSRDCYATIVNFEEWATEFGYDTDSRKAERTYLACHKIAQNFRELFQEVDTFKTFLSIEEEE